MVHGRDKFLRPICIMRPMILIRMGLPDIEAVKLSLIFSHYYVDYYMRQDGKIENQLVIFDLEFASPFTLPIKAMKGVEDTMRD